MPIKSRGRRSARRKWPRIVGVTSRIRAEFDTLQLYVDGKPQARVPFWKGDSDKTRLEPTTEAYEEYGEGGAQQVHLDRRTVKFDKVDTLPEE